MGRGYSASRSKSKRPTLRLKRERSASLHALKKSIEVHQAVVDSQARDVHKSNDKKSTKKDAGESNHLPLATTSTAVRPKMQEMSKEMQRQMLTLLPSSRKRASFDENEEDATVTTTTTTENNNVNDTNKDKVKSPKIEDLAKSHSTQRASPSLSLSTKAQEQQRRSASMLRHRLAAMEAELEETLEASEDEAETITRPDVMTKYKAAGRIVDEVLDMLCKECIPGANVASLCIKGDEELLTRINSIFTKPQIANQSNESKDDTQKEKDASVHKMQHGDARSQSQSSMFKTSVLNMRSYSARHGLSSASVSSRKIKFINNNNNNNNSKHHQNSKVKKKLLPRGICYPTNISVNDVLCNYAPFREDESYILESNDVVKIHLGVHLDGYPVSAARTIVVLSSRNISTNEQITHNDNSNNNKTNNNYISDNEKRSNADRRSIALETAEVYNTIEAARVALSGMIHLMQPGTVNNDITEFVASVGNHYGVEAVEGVLSHRTKRWVQDGVNCIIGRRIIHEDPHQEVEECSIGENQVWNLDIAFTNNKTYRLVPTQDAVTLHRRTPADYYNDARLEQANATLKTIDETCFCFPFHFARQLGNPLKAKIGLHVLVKQGIVDRLPVLRTKGGKHVTARYSATVAVSSRKITVLCGAPPSFLSSSISSSPSSYSAQKIANNTNANVSIMELNEQDAQPIEMTNEMIRNVLNLPLDFANTRRTKADGSLVTKRTRVDMINEEEEEEEKK